jgi:hypothetical protein
MHIPQLTTQKWLFKKTGIFCYCSYWICHILIKWKVRYTTLSEQFQSPIKKIVERCKIDCWFALHETFFFLCYFRFMFFIKFFNLFKCSHFNIISHFCYHLNSWSYYWWRHEYCNRYPRWKLVNGWYQKYLPTLCQNAHKFSPDLW